MIGQRTLPAGFRFAEGVLVNAGPDDPAAGRFEGVGAAPALWSRQVLTDGRLRAVAVVPPAPGPEPFQAVHAAAELVAGRLDVGAVEVAVCWADGAARHATRPGLAGWCLAGGEVLVLATDAALNAAALDRALAGLPAGPHTVVLLASCAGPTPDAGSFAAELTALCAELTGGEPT